MPTMSDEFLSKNTDTVVQQTCEEDFLRVDVDLGLIETRFEQLEIELAFDFAGQRAKNRFTNSFS